MRKDHLWLFPLYEFSGEIASTIEIQHVVDGEKQAAQRIQKTIKKQPGAMNTGHLLDIACYYKLKIHTYTLM